MIARRGKTTGTEINQTTFTTVVWTFHCLISHVTLFCKYIFTYILLYITYITRQKRELIILQVKHHLLLLSVTGSGPLGMCSSLCFGSLATVGLRTDPATFSLPLSSAAAADWLMVWMLFPRRAGGWRFLTLLWRLGDTVRTEASRLAGSPSGSLMFLSAAAAAVTSGGWSLAKVQVNTSASALQEIKI